MSHPAHSGAVPFFFRSSVSRGLFLWLAFTRYTEQSKTLTVSDNHQTPSTSVEWLVLWQQQTRESFQPVHLPWWLYALALVAGSITMAGVLAASVSGAINLWLPLFLFAFIPLLFSAASLIRAVWVSTSDTPPPGYQWLSRHYDLPAFRSHPTLLAPWLATRWQSLSALTLTGGLICFMVFATFQEVQFYWSSTFIQDSQTMAQMLSWVSLPWQFWAGSPSVAQVMASQYHLTGTGFTGSATLWQFIILSILHYGLLPRLLLILLFHLQLKKRLTQEIQHSGILEQFFNCQQQIVSHQPLLPEHQISPDQKDSMADEEHTIDSENAESVSRQAVSTETESASTEAESKSTEITSPETANLKITAPEADDTEHTEADTEQTETVNAQKTDQCLLGWRLNHPQSQIQKNLGTGSWREDEQWLTQLSLSDQQSVTLFAGLWQTPTGELADVLELLHSKDVQPELIILDDGCAPERSDLMLNSWQFFARQHKIDLIRRTL